MGCRGFDEVPQNVVVFDLQRRDRSLTNVLLLHACDDGTTFITQFARFVQIFVVTAGNEPAISDQKGRFGYQRRVQKIYQVLMADQIGRSFGKVFWKIQRASLICNGFGVRQRVAYRGQIARAAAAQSQAGQGAIKIGYFAQILADPVTFGTVFTPKGHGIQSPRYCFQIARGAGQAPF